MQPRHHDLTLALVREAASFLEGRVRRTPLLASEEATRILGRPVWLKLENLQLTGSFKVRGALFAMHRLSEQGVRGILTCSAGNHGLGVSYAAGALGMQATICVPNSVDEAKRDGLERGGASILVSPYAGFDDTEAWSLEQADRLGLPYLSAYDDADIMAGNGGSLALEIAAQIAEVGTVVVPVGGGGMSAGIVSTFEWIGRPVRLVAAQLAASPALARSIEQGEAATRMPPADTIAGGLEGGLGRLPFEHLKTRTARVELVDEADLREGVRWMLRHHGLLIEPSAAVAVAALRVLAGEAATGPVVVVLSGRNVAADTVHRILAAH